MKASRRRAIRGFLAAAGGVAAMVLVLLPSAVAMTTFSDSDDFSSACSYYGDPSSVGDGKCDSSLNVEGCEYDGGDCCRCTCVDQPTEGCGAYGYDCIDPSASCFGDPEPSEGSCINEGHDSIGNGYCSSVNNNAACDYDGGDCCESTCVDGDWPCEVDGYDCIDPDAAGSASSITVLVLASVGIIALALGFCCTVMFFARECFCPRRRRRWGQSRCIGKGFCCSRPAPQAAGAHAAPAARAATEGANGDGGGSTGNSNGNGRGGGGSGGGTSTRATMMPPDPESSAAPVPAPAPATPESSRRSDPEMLSAVPPTRTPSQGPQVAPLRTAVFYPSEGGANSARYNGFRQDAALVKTHAAAPLPRPLSAVGMAMPLAPPVPVTRTARRFNAAAFASAARPGYDETLRREAIEEQRLVYEQAQRLWQQQRQQQQQQRSRGRSDENGRGDDGHGEGRFASEAVRPDGGGFQDEEEDDEEEEKREEPDRDGAARRRHAARAEAPRAAASCDPSAGLRAVPPIYPASANTAAAAAKKEPAARLDAPGDRAAAPLPSEERADFAHATAAAAQAGRIPGRKARDRSGGGGAGAAADHGAVSTASGEKAEAGIGGALGAVSPSSSHATEEDEEETEEAPGCEDGSRNACAGVASPADVVWDGGGDDDESVESGESERGAGKGVAHGLAVDGTGWVPTDAVSEGSDRASAEEALRIREGAEAASNDSSDSDSSRMSRANESR